MTLTRLFHASVTRRVLVCLMMIGMPGALSAQAGEKEILAPTGSLRVGVYQGSPTSMVSDPRTAETHGVTYELGRELAFRLKVPVKYVTFQRIADVLIAIKDGQVDFTVSNATPARANDVDFSQPLLAVELGYLVPENSSIHHTDEIDRPEIRIGVTKGSTSERTLSARFKSARLVPADNVKVAIEMLRRGDLDLYATNKAILFEMSDSMPGARVLDGNWGVERMAVAIPKGREQGLPLVDNFVREVQSNGLLARIKQASGLRGAAKQGGN